MKILIHLEPAKSGHWSVWAKAYASRGLGQTANEAIQDFLMKLQAELPDEHLVEYFIDLPITIP